MRRNEPGQGETEKFKLQFKEYFELLLEIQVDFIRLEYKACLLGLNEKQKLEFSYWPTDSFH